MMDLHHMAALAREAAWSLAATPIEARNRALTAMAEALEDSKAEIFSANEKDLAQAERDQLAAPLLGRLRFGAEKLRQVSEGLYALAELPDPIGQTTMARELTEGLRLYRVTCPIGVIGVIFESRPDALVQIASLALKSSRAVGRRCIPTPPCAPFSARLLKKPDCRGTLPSCWRAGRMSRPCSRRTA